ncbi:glycosyltransferase involved in cell wall biosynthesis [Inhella inkyongensis]|uniref:Glycosyltransferase involved in cell wall biosynthesis n=1 Tax=Inhella inkyongensis TaxID=392593 RepID=A0A840S6R0_9BURK|nr:glycosyltransferase [Inhella inkyongensis]MBB5204474.1 glycosyltransferase involved in cell wall biosynthesis [Inhella inkyongensis]
MERLILTSCADSPWVNHEVVSLGGLGVIGPRLQQAGISVHCLSLDRLPWQLSTWWSLWRLLRQERATTVVQTWMYHADLLGGLLARLAGQKRVVWNVRQTGLSAADISARTRCLVRCAAWLSNWLPRMIVTNAKAAIDVHVNVGYASSRFTVIPNGFDTNAFKRSDPARRQWRRSLGLTDAEFLIGLVARLDPQKDHSTFLRMAALVAKAMPQARFLLAGRGVLEDAELTLSISELGLNGRMLRLDQQSDVASLMSALDLFCLSSRAEGFPNVLGEAMACEIPCVSTRCGDSAQLIQDGARLAPIEDASALANCVLSVAAMPPEARHALGQAQRQRIKAEFALPDVWQRYLELYQSLCKS